MLEAAKGTSTALRSNANLLLFLERHAPRELDAIRHEDPDNYELLRAKGVFDAASHGAVPVDAVLTPHNRNSLLHLTATYAAKMAPRVAALLAHIERRLRHCQAAKMLGGVVAVISGAALALIPALGYDRATVALWSAGFSCAGGLLTLAASAFERSPNGLRLSAVDYQSLAGHRAELSGIERRLDADAAFRMIDGEVIKLYNRTNEIADALARLNP